LAGFVRAERVAEHGRGLDNTGMRWTTTLLVGSGRENMHGETRER
jgi:hypothetical protein